MHPREGLRCASTWASAMRSQWLPTGRLHEQQLEALLQHVRFAARCVPFYRRAYARLDVHAESLRTLADLERLPLLRREQIQADPAAFCAEQGDRRTWHESHTSGSMGKPLQMWFDPECWWQVKYAMKARWLWAAGFRPYHRLTIVDDIPAHHLARHTARVALWGERLLRRRRYLSVFDAPASHVGTFIEFRPHFLYGFPSYFSELSRWWTPAVRTQVPLRAVITSGETLSAVLRQRLEATFAAPVLDVYGNTEVKDIAWRCRRGPGYHINMESVLVELIGPDGHAVPNGQAGEVVVTALTNRAMPLIRYATEDRAVRLGGTCPCGRGLERLETMDGRLADHLPMPAARWVSPYDLTTALSTLTNVLQFQLILYGKDELEALVVLRPGAGDTALADVEQAIGRRVGPELLVRIRQVAAIPRDASGKHRAIVVLPQPQGVLR